MNEHEPLADIPEPQSVTLSERSLSRSDCPPHLSAESTRPDSADRNPIDVLADELSARLRAGESPLIDEYLQRAPEHREIIRSLFPTIAMIERMSHQQQVRRRTRRPKLKGQEVIGDFQILREVGRGGMGIVYEALQRSLNRRVALKILGLGVSESPHQLQRFRREAESASRLHHTNIVPVYGIGEEDGIHFYAMQYIDGVPLAAAIETARHRSARNPGRQRRATPTPTEHTGQSGNTDPDYVTGSRPDPDVNNPTILMWGDVDSSSSGSAYSPPGLSPDSFENRSEQRFDGSVGEEADVAGGNSSVGSSVHSGSRFDYQDSVLSESVERVRTKLDAETAEACMSFFANHGTSEYFHSIAHLTAQVADTLDYAHQHGVLHRDIKPSNLMLDRDGGVWIMDFGLVKLLEQHDLTQTGEIVGTLRCMAPEQLDGRTESTTDIYSLGLTLYELLTLKPAFDGDQAVTLAQRLHRCDIPRPRSINAAIPRDLETIVLKATSREPSSRYSTAAKLAEDLRRFCDDRPILARRATFREQLWRWSRRNPALAVATGSVILLLGLIAAVTTAGRLKVEAAMLDVESAMLDAKAAQHRSDANLDSAVDAFDSILENVTSRGLPRSLAFDLPQSVAGLTQTPLSAADALLLDRLLEFYRNFANQSADNIRLRERIADAHRRAGAILVRLGRLSEAEDDFRRALASLATMLESDPHNIPILVKSASLTNELGELLLRRGEFRQTFNAHLEARALLLEQPISILADPAVRFELARSTDLFASIDARSGANEGPQPPPSRRPDGQTPFPGDGMAHPPKKDAALPPNPPLSERLKRARPAVMNTPGRNMPDELAMILLEASNEFRSLALEFPDRPEYRFQLAQCLRHRLVHAASNHQSQVASETFFEAVEILEQLAIRFPNEPKYLFELADTLTQASRAQSDEEAGKSLDRAVTYASQLASRFTSVSEYQLLLGTALARRAAIQDKRNLMSDAESSLKQSITILEPLAAQFPDQGIIQIPLGRTSRQLWDLVCRTADATTDPKPRLEEARGGLQAAINRFESYLALSHESSARHRKGRFNVQTRSSLYRSLSETLAALQLPEEAEESRKKAGRQRNQTP